MITIISLEYFLFKKKGPEIAKYSNTVDSILLLLFIGDWISCLVSSIYEMEGVNPLSFNTPALLGFTAFSWRTLLVTLLLQKWQLKIIAPITVTFVVTGYAIYSSQSNLVFLLSRTVMHLFNIVLIVYCQDKVKWRLMRTNLEQEKWMQVNNFILDSIPEKIMILDLAGEAKFMSEYCKKYLNKFNLSVDAKEFFKRVLDLEQLQQSDFEPPSPLTTKTAIETLTTCSGFYDDLDEDDDLSESESNFSKVGTLQDLIDHFPKFITSMNLQERQFLIYNGKFQAKACQTEKSMEMRVSFVHQYENDYIILIFRDTTQRDRLIALEETNKYKDHLLASISHELRAPLNGNINLVEGAINSPETSEEVKKNLLVPALRSSKVLLNIINDILDMTQIKQKKLRLVFQSASLEETLKNAAQLVEFQARKKGLDFLLEIDIRIPQNFCTDHLRVGQIVLNLLTNATKFTKQGRVKLIARMMDDNSSVKISVEDSGIGIDQKNLKKIFSSGTSIDIEDREKMNPHGVGLGLNIASNLVQLLAPEGHKKINIISTPGQGSSFAFVLENKLLQHSLFDATEELISILQPKIFEKIKTLSSLHSLSSKTGSTESSSQSIMDPCSCSKVLIVDDNPFNTMALETILRSIKIKCDSVYSGFCALEKLLSRKINSCGDNCKPYSVIFIDQEMPGMSGADTVKEIKKLQGEDKVSLGMRIIGCTTHKVKEEVDRFLASGLEACIFKPVSIAMIKDTLKEI